MIKGSEISSQTKALLAEGKELEEVLYQLCLQNLSSFPDHLKEDPEAIATLLSAI